MHRNKPFHPLIISFCVSLRAYMLDTVAISAVFELGLWARQGVALREG